MTKKINKITYGVFWLIRKNCEPKSKYFAGDKKECYEFVKDLCIKKNVVYVRTEVHQDFKNLFEEESDKL